MKQLSEDSEERVAGELGKEIRTWSIKQSGGKVPVLFFVPVSPDLVSKAGWTLEVCSGHGKRTPREALSFWSAYWKEVPFSTEEGKPFFFSFPSNPAPRQASYWSLNLAAAEAVAAGKAPKLWRGIFLSDQKNLWTEEHVWGKQSSFPFLSLHLVTWPQSTPSHRMLLAEQGD